MKLGTYFYILSGSEFLVYKLLGENNTRFLVTSFWPVDSEPTFTAIEHLDVAASCAEIDSLNDAHFFHLGELTEKEKKEIESYLRIKAGLANRTSQYQLQLERANRLFQESKWEEAAEIYSNVALYSKYSVEIYEKRGYCYLQLERYSDALYDFDFVLSSKPSDQKTLSLFEQCKTELHKKRK